MKRPEGFDRPSTPPPPAKTGRPALRRGSTRSEIPESVDRRARPVSPDAETGPIPITPTGARGDASPATGSPARRLRRPALPSREARRPRASRPSSPVSVRAALAEERRAARLRRRTERAEMRRFTRRSRNRRIAWLSLTGVVVVLTALIVTAVFSPLLALTTIRVSGTARLDPLQLEESVSGQLGTPLALLDEGEITAALSEFRLIRSYVTEVVPPDTLVIHVVERTPVGAVASDSGVELVDAAGVVVDRLPERPAGVPIIDLQGGDTDDVGFESMAEVLTAMPPELLARIDSIAATTRDDVTLTLVGGTQRVVWGSAARSQHKSLVLDRLLAANGNVPGEYDVSAPGSAVFRRE